MSSPTPLRVLVVGATGGSGQATVKALLAEGHEVTAFARHPEALAPATGLRRLRGDATHPADLDRAMAGQDAVVVTLGIRENPLRVRLLGAARTPNDVRSRGTSEVIAAMRRHGVCRLVVQSSFGVGDTRARLRWSERALFSLLLAPQIADTERQEAIVRGSGLDWVITRPVHLSNVPSTDEAFASVDGEVRRWSIGRDQVGRWLGRAVQGAVVLRTSVALSG